MGTQIYGYSPGEHEYSVGIPAMVAGDAAMTIYISAHGGGTVGKAYAGNGWDYLVTRNGATVLEGSDIRSGGMGAGHAEMARTLAGFLSAVGESFWSHEHMTRDGYSASEYGSEYTAEEAEFLAAEHERLGAFAADAL